MVVTKTARGWVLIAVGLLGSLVWAIGVTFAMPRPFLMQTARDVCAAKFDGFGENATVELWYFPPSGKCIDPASNYSKDVFTTPESAFLSVLLVLLVLLVITGIVLLLMTKPAVAAQPRPPSRVRAVTHLAAAAALGIMVSFCWSRLSLIGLLMGDIPGVLAAAGIAVAVTIAAATWLDGRFGRSDGRALRRGAVVGLVGFAAAIGIAVIGAPDPVEAVLEPATWRVLAAALPFAAVVLLQRVTGGLTR
jgi:hypothetical protein